MNIGDHDQVGFRLLTLFMLAVLVILALTRGTGMGQAAGRGPAPTTAAASSASAGATLGSDASVLNLRVGVGEAAQKAGPAVVRITTEAERVGESGEAKSAVLNVGSGVIYDRAGYILTNRHVLEGADRFTVSLPDGRAFAAELVGADPQTDLAVLRVGARGLPVAPLGDSARLQVGEWVVAIGHALGMSGGPTVTIGVVSALGRMVQEQPMGDVEGPLLYDLIQTDAPINPGNSGGRWSTCRGRWWGSSR